MLPENPLPETAVEERRPTNAIDLVLYLVGGYGLFFLASSALATVSEVGTPTDSAARYLLNLVFLGGTALVLGILRRKITWSQLGLRLSTWRWQWLGLAVLISIALNPLRAILALAIQLLFGGGLAGLQARSDILTAGGFSWPAFLLSLVGVGILAPLSEELYFRGLLYQWFREHARLWPSVLITSAMFGLGHFDSVGVVVASFIMGVVNALAYERTRTLWLPIAIHMVTNSSAVLLIYLSLAFGQNLGI